LKYVLLSADNCPSVYSVPEAVADNLKSYCLEFEYWLQESPHAAAYRRGGGVCFNEEDFVKYLNEWIFQEQPSLLIETLDWIDSDADVPQKYKDCKRFNF